MGRFATGGLAGRRSAARAGIAEVPIFRALMRIGEEIAEGDWERFSELDRELTATVRRLTESQDSAEV